MGQKSSTVRRSSVSPSPEEYRQTSAVFCQNQSAVTVQEGSDGLPLISLDGSIRRDVETRSNSTSPTSEADIPLEAFVNKQLPPPVEPEEAPSKYIIGKGDLHFWRNFAYETEQRPYITVRHSVSGNDVTGVLVRDWKFTLPRIAMFIVSDVGPLNDWAVPKQLENLKKGLIKAANTTHMWIFTHGLNVGITREIGDAVNFELKRRRALKCHKHPNRNKTLLPPITLVGVVRDDLLTYAEQFDGKHTSVQIENEGNRPDESKYDLNPDHSHYIIVKDETVNKTGCNYFTLRLERSLAQMGEDAAAAAEEQAPQSVMGTVQPDGKKQEAFRASFVGGKTRLNRQASVISMELPLIALLVQGDANSAKFIYEQLKKELPVVVLEGSGGLADILAFAYYEVKRRGTSLWDAEFVENFLKPELSSYICQYCPLYRENILARNMFRDKILSCIQLACQTQQEAHFTVVSIRNQGCNMENIDEILLKAVFKSQRAEQTLWNNQMRKDLLLTMDWNSPHLAVKEVFMKDASNKFEVDRDIFEQALLKPDREEFVNIFLNRGFKIHKYMTPKRLRQLFQKVQYEEFFRSVCWEGALGHSLFSRVGKNFIDNDLNWLIDNVTGLRDFVDTQELSMNAALGIYTQDPAAAERKALVVLCLWASFTNRRSLSKLLWQHCDQPIHLALLISMTYARLSYHVREGNIKQELLDTSEEFADMATGVLDFSYKDSSCRAYDILSEESPDWCYKTAVDIAAEAKNRTFLAHPCCQKWITNLFMGQISIRDLTWGMVKIPQWMKVTLCAFFIIPMYIWIRFKKDPHDMEYQSPEHIEEEEDERDGEMDYHADHNGIGKDGSARLPPVGFAGPKSDPRDRFKSLTLDNMMRLQGREMILSKQPPIWRMIYLMWNAPITKFWTFQMFYIVYLGLFSWAVLLPSCGNRYLDTVVCSWSGLILLESARRTYVLFKRYASVPLFLRCVEIILMTVFTVLYALSRVVQVTELISPYTAKVILCFGLVYAYYRQIVLYLPISPTLGPLLYRVRLMVMEDFINFMRMALLVIVSGGIVAHSLLYPDYPFSWELLRRAFHRSWFALFLTPIDDLVVHQRCEKPELKYRNASFEQCTQVSRYTDTTCPNTGFWPYLFTIQFLVFLKLILLTLLYALFSNTARKIEAESDNIWRFQRYQLVVDFINRLCFPPPLNIISYVIIFFQWLWSLVSCQLCKDKDYPDSHKLVPTSELAKPLRLSEKDYNYWRQLAADYSEKRRIEEELAKHDADHIERTSTILDDVDNQRLLLSQLTGQVRELQRLVGKSHAYLEELKHSKSDALSVTVPGMVHFLSRHSPYPSTRVLRFPVPDKYVPWEVMWLDYDPVAYTRPKGDFPKALQEHVDEDILLLAVARTDSREECGVPRYQWNVSVISPAGVSTDRRSWIPLPEGDGDETIIYKLDSEGVPRNPVGRTGLRGKGALPRWGPNHYVFFVISRWQRSKYNVLGGKGIEIVLMRIFRTDQFGLPGDFVPGENRYDHIMRALFKTEPSDVFANAIDVGNFFRNACVLETPSNEVLLSASSTTDIPQAVAQPPVRCDVISRGYMDDPLNTDHCWREVELWSVHYNVKDTLNEKFQSMLTWRLVTDDLFVKLPSGQSALLDEVTKALHANIVDYT